jgi:hypothetical protein
MVWGLVARGLLGRAFAGSATRAAAPAAAAATRGGLLSSVFGFAGRRPILTGIGADLALTGGDTIRSGVSWLGGQFMDAVRPDNGGDWMQLGAGLLAGMNALQGNYMGAAMLGAAAYFMDDILRIADEFLESKGYDIIPDEWHTPAAAVAAPERSAPAPA